MFLEKFSGYAGETIECEVDGFTVTARLEHDDAQEAPWDREDGHGPVSDWAKREKAPGERVLHSDRFSKRYYDFQEAVKIARRDGWGFAGMDKEPGLSKGAIAARAAEEDFKRLKAWCNDDWTYVGVVLSIERNGVTLAKHAASLWGIESDAGEYLTEVANELLDEALDAGRAALANLCKSFA